MKSANTFFTQTIWMIIVFVSSQIPSSGPMKLKFLTFPFILF